MSCGRHWRHRGPAGARELDEPDTGGGAVDQADAFATGGASLAGAPLARLPSLRSLPRGRLPGAGCLADVLAAVFPRLHWPPRLGAVLGPASLGGLDTGAQRLGEVEWTSPCPAPPAGPAGRRRRSPRSWTGRALKRSGRHPGTETGRSPRSCVGSAMPPSSAPATDVHVLVEEREVRGPDLIRPQQASQREHALTDPQTRERLRCRMRPSRSRPVRSARARRGTARRPHAGGSGSR